MKTVQYARAPWSEAVFICRKCARKAGAKRFRKDLNRALADLSPRGRFRVVEAGCLDLCPKKRIAIAVSGSVGPRRLLVALPEAAAEAATALLRNDTLAEPASAP